jgi:NSS family neurotransmitter:Na+ symporter
MNKGQNKEGWAKRSGFIAAMLGAMIGTGNLWRFPRMAALYGGGSFLIPWIIAMLLVSIPLLIAEGIIGRESSRGTIAGFSKYGRKQNAWLGAWLMGVNWLILAYYAVILGWVFRYIVYGFQGAFSTYIPGKGEALWNSFLGNPLQSIGCLAIGWIIVALILTKGIKKGIEKVNLLMVPLLIVLMIVITIRALTLPGALKGLEYFWLPKKEFLIKPETWLQAFSQSLWSTGAGWGIYLTYSSYLKKKDDINLNSFITGFGDSSFALIAGLCIIPTVAALAPTLGVSATEVYQSGNVGLTFIWLTEMFSKMPASTLIEILFFLAFFIAALTSMLGIAEVVIRNFRDLFGWKRKEVVILVVGLTFLASLPSAISVNFLNNQDWVWSLALLMSALMTFYVIIKKGTLNARKDANRGSDLQIGKWWEYLIKWVAPLSIICVLGWWFFRTCLWYPKTWWNPTEIYGVGTILLQWSILLLILIVLKRKIEKKLAIKEG